MKSSIPLFVVVILCLISFSCKDSNTLTGEWLRSDFSANSEYRITFEENNTGYIVNKETTKNGIISNAVSIDWKMNKDTLIIFKDNGDITTSFTFTANGNLILADFSAFDFIKQ